MKVGVRPISQSMGKLTTWLPTVKDPLGLCIPGIYRIPCGRSVGQAGRSVIELVGEHQRYIRL